VIILGLFGDLVNKESAAGFENDVDWWAGMGVFIGLIVMLWSAISIVLFFLALLLPLAVVIVDAFCTLFLLITMAGTGASDALGSGLCKIDDGFGGEFTIPGCSSIQGVIRGGFAMSLLGM
jgi:hypothetical protein